MSLSFPESPPAKTAATKPGMGIDAADVDGDGWQDIYVTHLDFELNRLYHNNLGLTFDDYTYKSGIGNKAITLSGVSMKFIDYDNDGWPDILQLNSAMLDNVNLYHGEVQYKEPLLMFRNVGKGQFEKVSDKLGPRFCAADRGTRPGDRRFRQRRRHGHRHQQSRRRAEPVAQ